MRHRTERIDNLGLPPEIPHKRIAAAADEYTRRQEEFQTVRQDEVELEQTREQAVEADRQAYADAVEAGKPDPGPKHAKAHEDKLADAVRRSEAVEVALERSHDRLLAAADEHRDELRAAVEKRVSQSRAALTSAIDEATARHADLQHALALSAWVKDFPGKARWAPSKYASVVHLGSGQQGGVAEVLAAVRVLAQPPPRRPGTMPVPEGPQPLRQAVTPPLRVA